LKELGLGFEPVIERPSTLSLAFEMQLISPLSNFVLRRR